jgi:diguanylate cyclase (GGDEF)-like protein/PAS domain S-box-containing protein
MESAQPAPSQGQLFRFDQSGALLRKVMENAAVGMALIGVDRRLLYANNAFAEMLGYEPDEPLGLDADALIAPEDTACHLQLNRLIAGEIEDYRTESRLVHKDGSLLWALSSVSVLRSDKTGRPLYVILQIINIDRQKRAEEALAYTEARWNNALEAAKQGVWDHDIRTDDMYYSPMWRKMRGIPQDEHVDPAQEAWLERVHPDDRNRIREVVSKQDTGEDGYDTLEYRERHRDGRYMWILSRGRPVEWDSKGVPIRTVGTDTDITRLKQVEASLAEEKERLRVTLESIGDGVISTDAETRVTFMNPIAEEMTGWTSEEAIGRQLSEVFRTVDQGSGKPAVDVVSECLSSGKPMYLDAEAVLVGRHDERRDIRSSAAPVRTPEGAVIGAVLVFQDITQSRALQKQLAHSASHDALTGLPNRVAFDRALAAAVESATKEHRSHALCFIDLDRFKPVNDSAGHAAGDALLRHVADAIRRNCRANDFAARIGGDEFALLLTDCPMSSATRVAQKIVEAISQIQFIWNGTGYNIGASVGVTSITRRPQSELGFTGEADAACYTAKRTGRGRVVVYHEDAAEKAPAKAGGSIDGR